jgi:hypothetical protein
MIPSSNCKTRTLNYATYVPLYFISESTECINNTNVNCNTESSESCKSSESCESSEISEMLETFSDSSSDCDIETNTPLYYLKCLVFFNVLYYLYKFLEQCLFRKEI